MKFKLNGLSNTRTSFLSKLNFLNRMKLWQKFALLGLIGAFAAALPTFNMMTALNESVEFASTEAAGVEPAQKLIKLVYLTQKHRGLAASYLGGDESVADSRAAVEKDIVKAVAGLDPLLKGVTDSKLQKKWAQIKTDWATAVSQVADRSGSARGTFNQHSDLISLELAVLDNAIDYWKLSLDPEASTYYLLQGALVHLPKLTEAMAQVRDFGAGRLAEAERTRQGGGIDTGLTPADRLLVGNLLHDFDVIERNSVQSFEKAIETEARVKAAISQSVRDNRSSAGTLIELTQYELTDREDLNFDSREYFNAFTETIDRQFSLIDAAGVALKKELDLRVTSLRAKQIALFVGVLVVFLVAALVAIFITLNITGTVRKLQVAVEKVREGDFASLSAIESRDEVGDLGRTVNSLLEERIAAQKKAEDDNEKLNESVIELLQAVYQMGQRDLTAQANVDESVIGTVASSINQLADATGQVLNQVTNIAKRVQLASHQVKGQAANVMEVARQEAISVNDMTKSVTEAVEQMNLVAQLAESTNKAATEAAQSTDAALERVSGTIKGMDTIRESIAESEKRIKRLGERSQEISGIVGLINTIAERTHVLSLNAAMQAAIAGDAGRGFAVVAEEVQRLAESSRNATSQIGTLIQNIQIETNETIATVNRTIAQVVSGSDLAQKAGEQMQLTQKITAALAALVGQIADGTALQTQGAAELQAGLNEIGRNTQRTSKEVEAQTVQSSALAEAAEQLTAAVSVFKLPQSTRLEETHSLKVVSA